MRQFTSRASLFTPPPPPSKDMAAALHKKISTALTDPGDFQMSSYHAVDIVHGSA